MDYGPSDSSGTDDDLPPAHPAHQNRVTRGSRVTGNGRTAIVGYDPRLHTDMESQIHRLEQEAYTSVLRAFKAQSDAITWEKEGLITELRKELRVTDEEHRDLLGRVNADDIIRRIREWRQGGGLQTGLLSSSQPVRDALPSPTVSASRKKQKTSQSMLSLSKGGPSPSPSLPHQQNFAGPMQQPPSSVAKRGSAVGARGKKPKSGLLKYPSTGPTGAGNMASRVTSGALAAGELNEAGASDPLIGRKVYTRWPDDNNFYEAVITSYDVAKGEHVLVYDMNTPNETVEYVNLNEISPDDIRWEGEDPGISRQAGRVGSGRGSVRRSMGRSGTIQGGRGRGAPKPQYRKGVPASENGTGKINADDIEILHTDTLIKEVEKVFNSAHPDPLEIDKAKRILKEHEQALVDAIARLADASDGESEEGEHQFPMGDRGSRNPQFSGGSQHRGFKGDAIPAEAAPNDHRDGKQMEDM